MKTTNACPGCGARMPVGAAAGPCPRCTALGSSAETAPGPRMGMPKSSGGPPACDWDEILRTVRTLDVIPGDALDRLAKASGADASRLARSLVEAKALTPYQARALLQGKARGLEIGHYLVENKLGAGGMGVVFKARHRASGAVIALKILPPSFGREPDAVRRFRREFQVAGRLNHPNIVRAIEANEDRGVHYLTMEYIPGYTLDTLVSRGGPMAIKLALHCVLQTARGLEAAHAQGVIHRDIKPANIIIDPIGAVRVLDLGLARVIESMNPFGRTADGSLTQTGATMGTVDYLSPEQANDAKSADGRSDIYSLGCTLYFLLTGKAPFPGDTVLKRLMAHQDRPAPSLRAANREVSGALEDVYLKMMAKRPIDRPPSMAEVVMELEACRTSTREAGSAGDDLKTFARTAMKRAPVRGRRGPDASIFAQPSGEAGDLEFDPDLNLEDLVSDYREMVPSKPIPEEKLPPILQRPLLQPQRQRSSPPYRLVGIAMIGCLVVGFSFWPKSKTIDSESVSSTDKKVAPTLVPEKDDKGPVRGAFQLLRDPEGSRPTLLANYRPTAPVADGVIQPDEYGPGVEVDFDANSRFGALLANLGDPKLSKTPDDLSVMLHAGYTTKSLFLAIRVRDQFIDAQEADKGQPFLNDCIELFFDGDRVQNDFLPIAIGRQGSPEGFQIMADAAGHQLTVSRGFTSRDWKAASKRTVGGYVVEFEVPLTLLDMQDGPEKAQAGPGSLINFGMAIGDNDLETSRHMSYAYIRARKGVGAPTFGCEVAWTMGIRLMDSSTGADGSESDLAISAGPKAMAADYETLSVFYKEGVRLSDRDHLPEGVGLLKQAMELLRKLIAEHPERADYRNSLGVYCNKLSAHYSTYLDPQDRNPRRALELSNEAVLRLPNDANSWKNLGWARYRLADWKGCVEAIDKSVRLSNNGAGWDWFFLAMAHKQLGENDLSKSYYDKAVASYNAIKADAPQHTKARRLRDEASAALGITVKK